MKKVVTDEMRAAFNTWLEENKVELSQRGTTALPALRRLALVIKDGTEKLGGELSEEAWQALAAIGSDT